MHEHKREREEEEEELHDEASASMDITEEQQALKVILIIGIKFSNANRVA